MSIEKALSLNAQEISRYLEIAPPFLMIDLVERLVPGKTATAVKNLAAEDWFFGCHLPRERAMPGTLQVEAMLQTLVLTIYTLEGHEGKLSFITEMKTKLLSKVPPGCRLVIQAELLSFNRGIAKGAASGSVNGVVACRGEFTLISPHALPVPGSPSRSR